MKRRGELRHRELIVHDNSNEDTARSERFIILCCGDEVEDSIAIDAESSGLGLMAAVLKTSWPNGLVKSTHKSGRNVVFLTVTGKHDDGWHRWYLLKTQIRSCAGRLSESNQEN